MLMNRTKKVLLAGTALLALGSAAFAADLPSRAPAPYIAAPVFTWTGFYVGVNAGYGFADRDNDDFAFGSTGLNVNVGGGLVAPVTPFGGTVVFNNNDRSRDGFVGGGQIGYNWQVTPGAGWVVGVEGDVQYADLSGGNHNNNFAVNTGNGLFLANTVAPVGLGTGIAVPTVGSGSTNIALFNNGSSFGSGCGGNNNFGFGGSFSGRCDGDWFATVRGRIGYAWDRVLVYATGGVAFTDSGSRNNNFVGFGGFAGGAAVPAVFFVSPAAATAAAAVAPGTFGFGRNRADDVGYAVGGGVEYAFTNNWTVKLEGLYVNFGNGDRNNGFAGASVVGVSNTGAPITAAALGFNNNSRDNDFGVVRVGLNYKFGTW